MAKLNPHLLSEFKNIISSKDLSYPSNLVHGIGWLLASMKGENLKIYDVSKSSSLADTYVIVTTNNSIQAQAMTQNLCELLKIHHYRPNSVEGQESGHWVLVDLGDIIVHLMDDYSRETYGLDDLWAKYDRVQLPNEYYQNSALSQGIGTQETYDEKTRNSVNETGTKKTQGFF